MPRRKKEGVRMRRGCKNSTSAALFMSRASARFWKAWCCCDECTTAEEQCDLADGFDSEEDNEDEDEDEEAEGVEDDEGDEDEDDDDGDEVEEVDVEDA
jgi:hypothetical protein